MNILVIDAGSTSMRGILFGPEAQPLLMRRRDCPPRHLGDGRVEMDPALLRRCLYAILSETADWCRTSGASIGAVALTAQRSSLIALGAAARPLHPAIMWQDTRAAQLVRRMEPHFGAIFQKTGARPNTVFSAGKMAWLKAERPEVYRAAHKLVCIADYLLHAMTGELVTDESYGSRTLLMDIRGRRWDGEMLKLWGVDAHKLCALIPPGSVAGRTGRALCEATGIPEGLPVVSAGGDQQCAAMGQGVVRPGRLAVTAGTGVYVAGFLPELPATLDERLLYSASAQPGGWLLEGSVLGGGSAYDWFCRSFYTTPEHPGGDRAQMNREIMDSPPGANGCGCLPFLSGSGTPHWDPDATGRFAGLRLSTTRGDMARALMEGIACQVADNVAAIDPAGEASQIALGGGLAGFDGFCQALADACARPVLRGARLENTAFGAWLNAAVSLGLYRDLSAACAAAGEGGGGRFDPIPGNRAVYARLRGRG